MTTLERKVDALAQMFLSEDPEAVEEARQTLRMLMREPVLDACDTETRIRNLLVEIGVPSDILGHAYAVTAVELVAADASLGRALTKELWPMVAEIHTSDCSKVERSIRYAIEVACGRGDPDVLYRYFGNTVNANKGKPTAGEFITRIAEVVRAYGN